MARYSQSMGSRCRWSLLALFAVSGYAFACPRPAVAHVVAYGVEGVPTRPFIYRRDNRTSLQLVRETPCPTSSPECHRAVPLEGTGHYLRPARKLEANTTYELLAGRTVVSSFMTDDGRQQEPAPAWRGVDQVRLEISRFEAPPRRSVDMPAAGAEVSEITARILPWQASHELDSGLIYVYSHQPNAARPLDGLLELVNGAGAGEVTLYSGGSAGRPLMPVDTKGKRVTRLWVSHGTLDGKLVGTPQSVAIPPAVHPPDES